MSRSARLLGVAFVCASITAASAAAERIGIGRAPSAEELAAWNITVRGDDGAGLPPGKGSVSDGEEVYAAQCAACHGDFGEAVGRYPVLMGGVGTLKSHDPVKTVGSYWPYAPTLFDYIRRAMPFGNAQSLSNDETYAVTAYVLHLNDILPADAMIDAQALAAVQMPNRAGFTSPDPRPELKAEACMTNCRKGPPEITSEAKNLEVSPPLD